MSILTTLLKWLCAALLLALILNLGVNVFMRYALGEPFSWSGEVGRLLLVWISFFGAALAGADRRHMAMELLKTSLSARLKWALDIALSATIIVCLALLVYQGVSMTSYNVPLNSEHLQISYAFFYAAIPVGLACYLLFELSYLFRVVRMSTDSGNGASPADWSHRHEIEREDEHT